MAIHEYENRQLVLLPEAEVMLDEARKWGKFLAILGFVFSGFMLLFGVVFSFFLDNLPPEAAALIPNFIITVIYLVLAAIYFFPSLYLYRFAVRAGKAISLKDSSVLSSSFDSLRDCFRYLGILSIIALVLYGIGFLIVIASMMFLDNMSPDSFM